MFCTRFITFCSPTALKPGSSLLRRHPTDDVEFRRLFSLLLFLTCPSQKMPKYLVPVGPPPCHVTICRQSSRCCSRFTLHQRRSEGPSAAHLSLSKGAQPARWGLLHPSLTGIFTLCSVSLPTAPGLTYNPPTAASALGRSQVQVTSRASTPSNTGATRDCTLLAL